MTKNVEKKKIAVLVNSFAPEWQSCKTISQNLVSSYKKYGAIFFSLPKNNDSLGLSEIVAEIKEGKFDEIIWLEYKPSPTKFLKSLLSAYKDDQLKPCVRFHIYGDFILNILDWQNSREALIEFRVQFIVASSKQRLLLQKLMVGEGELIADSPFPVDTKFFHFDESERKKSREKMGFKEDDIVILYSGRLSYQKNIIHLMYAVREFMKFSTRSIKLLFAGPMDDLGIPYVGRSGPLGAFYGQYSLVKDEMKDLFEDGSISNLGNVNQESLRGLYNASDLFINLSTHNDEDYGMAPAEALSTGCPGILSNWGGFYSFGNFFKEDIELIDVKKEKGRFLPSYAQTVKALLKFTSYSNQQRKDLASKAEVTISINECVKNIDKGFLNNGGKLLKFTDDFHRVAASFRNFPAAPFKGQNGELNDCYFEIYKEYAGRRND